MSARPLIVTLIFSLVQLPPFMVTIYLASGHSWNLFVGPEKLALWVLPTSYFLPRLLGMILNKIKSKPMIQSLLSIVTNNTGYKRGQALWRIVATRVPWLRWASASTVGLILRDVLALATLTVLLLYPDLWLSIPTLLAAIDVIGTLLVVFLVKDSLPLTRSARIALVMAVGCLTEIHWCYAFWHHHPTTLDPKIATWPVASGIVFVAMSYSGIVSFYVVANFYKSLAWTVMIPVLFLWTLMIGAHICSATALFLITRGLRREGAVPRGGCAPFEPR